MILIFFWIIFIVQYRYNYLSDAHPIFFWYYLTLQIHFMKSCIVFISKVLSGIINLFNSLSYSSKLHIVQNRKSKNIVHKTDRILHKNRSILMQFKSKGAQTVNNSALVEKGFDFRYFTKFARGISNDFYFCYEIGYQIDDQQLAFFEKKKTG